MTKNNTNTPASSSDKQQKILEALLQQAKEVIDIDHFVVALYDRRTVTLQIFEYERGGKLARLVPEDKDENKNKRAPHKPTNKDKNKGHPYQPAELVPDCLIQQVSAPILAPTQQEFVNWLEEVKMRYRFDDQKTKSWMAVPLKGRSQTIGVIIVEHFEEENLYSEDDLHTLKSMADRVTTTLTRIRQAERLQAINEVGQEIAASVSLRFDRQQTLEKIYEEAGKLMDTRNMYVALYNEAKQELTFPLAYYNSEKETLFSQKVDIVGKSNWSATQEVFVNRKPLRISYFEEYYEAKGWKFPPPPPKSWLGVPLISGDKVLGVIALQNDEINGLYTQRDVEVLQAMANQAAIAIANARLVENMLVVSEIGQQLTSKVQLDTNEILDLVYDQADNLPSMDTRDMYIALYDEASKKTVFPLAFVDGEREEWPDQGIDLEDKTSWSATKEVLTGKSTLNIPNFVKYYNNKIKNDREKQWQLPPIKPYPTSWLGVPLISGDKVLGMISLQNDEVESAFGNDDVEVLEIIAGQAAVAIQNATLYQEVTQKNDLLNSALNRITETETVLTRANIATDFVHRLNNLAGTIPIWLDQIRDHLGAKVVEKDTTLKEYLDNIESNTDDLLRAAEQLKAPSPEEDVDLEETLKSLVRQVRVQTPAEIEVNLVVKELPTIRAVSSELPNALWSIIENSIDAMPHGGSLDIEACTNDEDGRTWVEIIIEDSGSGIPPEQYNNIFMPFYTAKGGAHMGYGLWRAKNTFERLGGEITFESVENEGTAFTIKLPT